MFVKIENYYGDSKPLLLNIDNIICIKPQSIGLNVENNKAKVEWGDEYEVWYGKDMCFILNKTQYEELCRVLNRVSK